MPELPDVELYLHALRTRVVGLPVERVRTGNPFVVRTYDPPISAIEGVKILGLERLGKRLVFAFDDDLFMIVHLMIAGRFRWRERGAAIPGKIGLMAFDFAAGTLLFTEAGSSARPPSISCAALRRFARTIRAASRCWTPTSTRSRARLTAENHTLKRALTDPHIFSGIGNAYSDEILHAARLSPMKLTSRRCPSRKSNACFTRRGSTLQIWIARLREEAGDDFPEKVTAFRNGMAVHGSYGKPCPVCGSPVQRIVYARNEANYCSRCQTGGRLLSDRALSRLLKDRTGHARWRRWRAA